MALKTRLQKAVLRFRQTRSAQVFFPRWSNIILCGHTVSCKSKSWFAVVGYSVCFCSKTRKISQAGILLHLSGIDVWCKRKAVRSVISSRSCPMVKHWEWERESFLNFFFFCRARTAVTSKSTSGEDISRTSSAQLPHPAEREWRWTWSNLCRCHTETY